MDSIATLKEFKGSAPNRIQDHIVSGQRNPLKNARFQIKNALKTGLKTGLLREVCGKFKLGLDPKDYTVFKNFCRLEKNKGVLPVRESKRSRRRPRKRGGSRGRHGRRRRRALGPGDDISNELQDSGPGPSDRGGRHRRKRRPSRHRRRRRGRKHADEGPDGESDSSHSKDVTHKSSEEKPKTPKSVPGRNDKDGHETSRSDEDKTVAESDHDNIRNNHCFHGMHPENDPLYGPQGHGHFREYHEH
ncbi:hypothetical protein JTB14_026089 [Gonioctena quinquepunctata]|nr:hypothetical protein JTB14_026089 [Gonioctena quinquepunctata]